MVDGSSIRRVLVTGNMGYIGSVMTPLLAAKGYKVIGLDTGYFGDDCRLYQTGDDKLEKQIKKDIRDLAREDLAGIDAVIHLAGLSNDPLGEFNPSITEDINYRAAINLAECAREAGVKRFVYASSQSMYGVSKTDKELDEDDSDKNPVTVYAKTKWLAECELRKLHSDTFVVSYMRPSTVFGASPKLRCDIVYNNLVACAFTTGTIEIKSDGTPWRPVIHVDDVCQAFIAGLTAPAEIIGNRAFNIGIPDGNFTVRQLAEAAQAAVPGSALTFTGEHGGDSRTYRVGFSRILSELNGYYQPEWNLNNGGEQLVKMFQKVGFTEADFRSHRCTRLAHLKKLIAAGELADDLRWKK